MTLSYDHLLSKQPVMGETDCLSLFRQFYADNFGIHIKNYARPKDWDASKLDLTRQFYEAEGFEMITDWKIKDLRPGDVLCMAIGASNANHFAIYIGDGDIVHHPSGRLSTREPLRDFWRSLTCYILRHPDVPDLTPTHPNTTLQELLRARHPTS